MKNATIGQVGVYRTAAELMLVGFDVSFPAVDDGVDLTVGWWDVQVKSTLGQYENKWEIIK